MAGLACYATSAQYGGFHRCQPRHCIKRNRPCCHLQLIDTRAINHVNETVKNRLYEWYKAATRAANMLSSRDHLFEVFMTKMCIGQGNLLEAKLALESCCLGAENTSRRSDIEEIYVPALCKLFMAECQLGNMESAADVAQRALVTAERNHLGHSEEVFWARFTLGNCQIHLSEFGFAKANFRKCFDSRERHSELHSLAMQRLAEMHVKNGDGLNLARILLTYVHEVAKRSMGGESE
jgi:hypothetical protein